MSAAKTKTAKAPARLSLAEVFKTAQQYEDAQKAEVIAKKLKTGAQKKIIQEVFERRKLKTLSSTKYGPHTRITVVQNETVQYDGPGLFEELTVPQRRMAYDRNINLNALPSDARKRVLAVLSKDELAEVTTYSLNVERLSEAVQSGKIRSKIVAKFAEVVKSAPYIRVSHGADK